MAAHNEFGATAEQRAADLLEAGGWTVLHCNWRWRRREIDLIVRRGATVAFVEVRARRSASRGHPFETIDWRKRRELELAARAWIAHHGDPADDYRFDAISVLDPTGTGLATAEIEHLPHAWRA